MITQQYIINDIVPFDINTKIEAVQEAFSQLTYSHIPVFRDEEFIGNISENDVHSYDALKNISEYQYSLEPFHVRENTNWLDILEAFALNNSNIMPVLSENNIYLGYFELGDIMSLFNETPFLNEPGGIIVVEKGFMDYSFSEICQIVESNNAKLLGVFISKIENDVVQVTLKIGQKGINSLIQTFRRYNYNIISSHEEDKFLDDLRERSKYLEKYLNI